MKVSIVVANNGRNLTELRRSLENSTYKEYDLIVIDRGLERSIQRNIGISKADGTFLMWLDSDQSVSPGLIQECVDMAISGIDNIYIPEVIVADSFFGRIRAFERTFLTGTYVDVPRFTINQDVPKFDESISGPEDALFGSMLKGKRAISKNVLYHHDDISFSEYIRKKNYYGKSMQRYAELNPTDPCLKFKYRCFTVYTENYKWLRLLRHPILSLGIVFMLVVRGAIYFKNIFIDKPNR